MRRRPRRHVRRRGLDLDELCGEVLPAPCLERRETDGQEDSRAGEHRPEKSGPPDPKERTGHRRIFGTSCGGLTTVVGHRSAENAGVEADEQALIRRPGVGGGRHARVDVERGLLDQRSHDVEVEPENRPGGKEPKSRLCAAGFVVVRPRDADRVVKDERTEDLRESDPGVPEAGSAAQAALDVHEVVVGARRVEVQRAGRIEDGLRVGCIVLVREYRPRARP